jgi:hypothetical protein
MIKYYCGFSLSIKNNLKSTSDYASCKGVLGIENIVLMSISKSFTLFEAIVYYSKILYLIINFVILQSLKCLILNVELF